MKKHKLLNLLLILSFGILNSSFIVTPKNLIENVTANTIFTLVYIDHSRPGLSENMLGFINTTFDSISNPFLLYLSDGDQSVFTKDAAKVDEKLKKLSQDNSQFPDFIRDKKTIFTQVRNEKMEQYQTIRFYFLLTENYLKDLLEYNPAYFIKLFPTEMLFLTGNEKARAEVFIYYTPNPESKSESYLKGINSRLNFYNSDKYSKNISYFISKK